MKKHKVLLGLGLITLNIKSNEKEDKDKIKACFATYLACKRVLHTTEILDLNQNFKELVKGSQIEERAKLFLTLLRIAHMEEPSLLEQVKDEVKDEMRKQQKPFSVITQINQEEDRIKKTSKTREQLIQQFNEMDLDENSKRNMQYMAKYMEGLERMLKECVFLQVFLQCTDELYAHGKDEEKKKQLRKNREALHEQYEARLILLQSKTVMSPMTLLAIINRVKNQIETSPTKIDPIEKEYSNIKCHGFTKKQLRDSFMEQAEALGMNPQNLINENNENNENTNENTTNLHENSQDKKSNKTKYIVAGAIIGAIALIAVAGFIVYKTKSKKTVQI